MSDAALASRARAGDAQAFAALVDRYRSTIFALCRSVLGNADDAQDAAQDAVIRLWQRLPEYRGEAPLRVFASRLALHVAIDHRRKQQRGLERGVEPAQLSRASDPRPRPDAELERTETRRALSGAFAHMGEMQRAILCLREIDGLSYSQIARALRIPLGTVMSRLFYARRALRALLAPEACAAF